MAQTTTETTVETHTDAAGATQGTSEGTETHGGAKFPPLDNTTYPSQLLWLVIFFTGLYFLMSRVMLPKISSILENRKNRIDGDLARAQALKNETEAAIASYEKALSDARSNANDIARVTRENVTKDIDIEQSKVNQMLAQKIAEAEARIAKSKAAAMESVESIASESANEIIAALTGGKTAKADVAKAISAIKR
jgi:F-type H+-transporting ATPase subunit b